MKEVDELLNSLGSAARKEPTSEVNVRSQVLKSLAIHPAMQPTTRFDLVPIAFGGIAVAVAAVLCVVCLPSFQALSDPWASYFTP